MKIGPISLPLNGVKMIYNDDIKAMDFLLDLKMPGLLEILMDIETKSIPFTTACLFSFEHKIAIVIVYKPIKLWTKFREGNYLIFVTPTYDRLMAYFILHQTRSYLPEDRDAIMRLTGDITRHRMAIELQDTSRYEKIGNFFKSKG